LRVLVRERTEKIPSFIIHNSSFIIQNGILHGQRSDERGRVDGSAVPDLHVGGIPHGLPADDDDDDAQERRGPGDGAGRDGRVQPVVAPVHDRELVVSGAQLQGDAEERELFADRRHEPLRADGDGRDNRGEARQRELGELMAVGSLKSKVQSLKSFGRESELEFEFEGRELEFRVES